MNTQTTFSDYASTDRVAANTVARVSAATRRAVRSALRSMLTSHWERNAVRELSALPDHILADIGVTRTNIRGVAAAYAREKADAWERQAESSTGFGG